MTLPESMARNCEYDRWANARVIESLRSAQRALEQGPGGAAAEAPALIKARQIWSHVQWARRLWLSRLGKTDPPDHPDRFPAWSIDRIARETAELDALWQRYVAGLGAADLSLVIRYSTVDGQPVSSAVGDILTHVVNHSTYHRGQVARLVAECGGAVAATDFILFAREHPPAGVEPS